jgi:PEP-CTERM motif
MECGTPLDLSTTGASAFDGWSAAPCSHVTASGDAVGRRGRKKMRRYLGVLAAVLCLSAGSAKAATVFSDNFNSENGGVGVLNYGTDVGTFAHFGISGGSVDLIGNGYFDFYPGNGLYVDLDGSTSGAGLMSANPISLGPGSYTLSFYLGGNQRGYPDDAVSVNVFGSSSYGSGSYNLTSSDPLAQHQISFTLGAPDAVKFSFQNAGGDNVGAILDNITIDSNEQAPVPEPASMLLLGSGIVAVARRRWLA